LDKCRQDGIVAKAPGQKAPPPNALKPARHSSDTMSPDLPKLAVWRSLVSQRLSADRLAQMSIIEDPEWMTELTIMDDMISSEDLAAVRRLEADSAYEADSEHEQADDDGEVD
jgi:hypothetical protein